MESVSSSSQATERTPRPRLRTALVWKAAWLYLVVEEEEEELHLILPALASWSQHLALKSVSWISLLN